MAPITMASLMTSISEMRGDQKKGDFKISSSRSYMKLKFSPVVHIDKRQRSAKFQVGNLHGLYFILQSANYEKCFYLGLYNWYWLQIWQTYESNDICLYYGYGSYLRADLRIFENKTDL